MNTPIDLFCSNNEQSLTSQSRVLRSFGKQSLTHYYTRRSRRISWLGSILRAWQQKTDLISAVISTVMYCQPALSFVNIMYAEQEQSKSRKPSNKNYSALIKYSLWQLKNQNYVFRQSTINFILKALSSLNAIQNQVSPKNIDLYLFSACETRLSKFLRI